MDKNQRITLLKIIGDILPMTAVLGSIVGIFILSNNFTNLSTNYKEVILATGASIIGIVISFLLLKLLKQKREGTIFISYNHKDKKFVDRLIQSLKVKRFNIIYDEEVIKIGDNIKEVILKNIDRSDLIILILSDNFEQDTFLSYEVKYAIEKNKKVFPVVISDNTQIPSELSNLKYADFSKSYEDNLRILTKSLISTLEEKISSS